MTEVEISWPATTDNFAHALMTAAVCGLIQLFGVALLDFNYSAILLGGCSVLFPLWALKTRITYKV